MSDHPPTWLYGLEPLLDRRRSDRRTAQRRGASTGRAVGERRSGADRRLRERRETVAEHLRNALQVLLHSTVGRDIPPDLRYDIAAAVRRIWLTLQELERLKR